jgi:hypothetical protein
MCRRSGDAFRQDQAQTQAISVTVPDLRCRRWEDRLLVKIVSALILDKNVAG